MNKLTLLTTIKAEFDAIEKLFQTVEETHFMTQPQPEKWSMAQHAQHLIEAVRGIAGALKDTSKLAGFDAPNRPAWDYATIKVNYEKGLAAWKAAGKLPYRHIVIEESKTQLLDNFKAIHQKLLERADALNESDFDTLNIPHPVIGMMTMREILLFTAIHIKHHFDIVVKM